MSCACATVLSCVPRRRFRVRESGSLNAEGVCAGAVISHRGALRDDFGAEEGLVTLTDPTITQNYLISLPGVHVVVTPGPGPTPYDCDLGVGKTLGQMDGTIHVSGLWRAILENLEPRRVMRALGQSITVPASDLKTFLADRLSTPKDVDHLQENIVLGVSVAPIGIVRRLRRIACCNAAGKTWRRTPSF